MRNLNDDVLYKIYLKGAIFYFSCACVLRVSLLIIEAYLAVQELNALTVEWNLLTKNYQCLYAYTFLYLSQNDVIPIFFAFFHIKCSCQDFFFSLLFLRYLSFFFSPLWYITYHGFSTSICWTPYGFYLCPSYPRSLSGLCCKYFFLNTIYTYWLVQLTKSIIGAVSFFCKNLQENSWGKQGKIFSLSPSTIH